MWTREELKRRAKDVLRANYWTAFVVSLVLVFVSREGSSGGGSGSGDLAVVGRCWLRQ